MVLAMANVTRCISKQQYLKAFFSSALSISVLLITVAIELYPNLVLSTLDERWNLTVHNASSSAKSLKILLIMAVVGVPLVISYTTFVFWTFKGKVRLDETSY
jgi:cytochrome d ubiquinol oxidase subunit II